MVLSDVPTQPGEVCLSADGAKGDEGKLSVTSDPPGDAPPLTVTSTFAEGGTSICDAACRRILGVTDHSKAGWEL